MAIDLNKISSISGLDVNIVNRYFTEKLLAPDVSLAKSSANFNENIIKAILNTAYLYYLGGDTSRQVSLKNNEIKVFYENSKYELDSLYAKVYSQLRSNSLSDNTLEISFSNDYNENTEVYTDRYGESVNNASIVKPLKSLTLPSTIQQSAIVYNNVVNASCSINEQVGNGLKLKNDTNINNIIDQSYNTYWKEELLVPSILNNVSTPSSNIDYGAICEIKITLESIRRINSINVNTFSKFPIELCYIKYTESDNRYEPKKQFIHGVNIPSDALSESNNLILDECSMHFPKATVKNIFIGFTQPHYELNTISAPKKMLSTREYEYTDFIKDNEIDLTVFDNEEEINITSYKYEYGFTDIDATYSDYSNKGIYVTKPYPINGNLSSASIEAEEYEPVCSNSSYDYITDIEYYVATNKAPKAEDWVSILPINKNIINCERLFSINDICKLRFKASSIINVFINGEVLPTGDYIAKKSNDNITAIYIPSFNNNCIYSISYVPVDNSKYINFKNDTSITTTSEVIYCNGLSNYNLSQLIYNGFIEIEILNNETNEKLTEASNEVVNLSKNKDKFKFQNQQIQYYTIGNKLFFNKNLETNYTIVARYSTHGSYLMLKTILRRNSASYRDLTNVVRKIKVKTNTY